MKFFKSLLSVGSLLYFFTAVAKEESIVILSTTDLHGNVLNYDYYKDEVVKGWGFSKAYTVIESLRKEYPNSFLVDAGDTIQGSPLAGYEATVIKLKETQAPAIIEAMNIAKFDVGVLGNHEFNFGLDYLQHAIKTANFPILNANIFKVEGNDSTKYPYLAKPYVLQKRTLGNGKEITVGFTSFAPPDIMKWDARHVTGKLEIRDVLASAKKTVVDMKKDGADIVVVISHGGINNAPYREMSESAGYYIAQLPEVNAVVTGHSHAVFPSEKYKGLSALGTESSDVNMEKGTIAGKPVVMAGSWGSHVGFIELKVEQKDGKWVVNSGTAKAYSVEEVESSKVIEEKMKARHEVVLKYMAEPIGEISEDLTSMFTQLVDSSSLQLVNMAQADYIKKVLEKTDYNKMPVLSAAAPFMTGFRDGGDYTLIKSGKVSMRNMNALYLYPNTIHAVKVTGAELKAYLEKTAENFVKVDPNAEGEFSILNPSFKGYNFDVIDGVNYEINLTKDAGSRIENLTYNGKPVIASSHFVIATNNYRAFGGGSFPGMTGDNVIYSGTYENRVIITDFISKNSPVKVQADNNWKIQPIKGVKGTWTYKTGANSSQYAPKFATKHSEDNGYIVYKIDFSKM